jgi:hypothetical protein
MSSNKSANHRTLAGAIGVLLLATSSSFAATADILILTGSGTSNLNAPLTAAGFNVINGTLAPGQIAANITGSTVGVYIWNDGSLGNTGSPVNPSLAFNAADQTALTTFNASHNEWIMDGLSWRGSNADESAFDENEALALAAAGGGIVLGADDASGAEIIQHVNQVGGWFNFNPFEGVYLTAPGAETFGGSFFTTPNVVNVTNVVGTTTYSEVPNGSQPNGIFLATAVFGSPSAILGGYAGISTPLGPDTFGGVTYQSVNHLVTTNIAGAGLNSTPEPATVMLLGAGLGLIALCRFRKA